MQLSDFDYDLPNELIATEPVTPRDASRMMVVDAPTNALTDSYFRNLPEFLGATDVLVLNDTRVIRARTRGQLERVSGSSREIEVFFAEPLRTNVWKVLCKPGRRIRPGDRVLFGKGAVRGTFRDSLDTDLHVLEVESSEYVMDQFGQIPLPPYISREPTEADDTSYQTVFAAQPGAVAAPTAGLHFTEGVLEEIRRRGIEIVYITLHVGIGTFLPVRSENPEDHVLRPERYDLNAAAAKSLQAAVKEGRRIVAVGTTTTRTLEYVVRQNDGAIQPGHGYTDLYILPGFEFRIVNTVLTNFHLPRSTLLMLVSAFAGRERVLAAYRHAIAARYRFYSYGDCMLINRS